MKWVILVNIITCLAFAPPSDNFQKVLERIENPTLEKGLKNFAQGGIEKPVSTKNYSSDQVIETARTFLGTPHEMGGTSQQGMDCSGLVMVAHRRHDVNLPHSSQGQARYGTIVPTKDALQRGDLVFFYNTYKTSRLITHSGIYLGNGKFIHTSKSKGVKTTLVDDPYYWGERFLFGTRLQ